MNPRPALECPSPAANAPSELRSIVTLSEHEPERAVTQLLVALAADPPADSPLLAQRFEAAGLVCGVLRRQGLAELALRLASAGKRRTPRLRLEEALSACAAEELELAAELVAADPLVGRVVGPVLAALSGADVTLPRTSRSPATKRLHSAARAFGQLRQGNGAAAAKTIAALNDSLLQYCVNVGRALAAGDFRAHEGSLSGLLQSRVFHDDEALTIALINDASAHGVRLNFPDDALRRRLSKSVWRHLVRSQLASSGVDPARVAAIVRATEVLDYPAKVHASYWLWRGFAELRTKADRADRSLTLGAEAEQIEALRGLYVSAVRELEVGGPNVKSAKKLAGAAERLSRALQAAGRVTENAVLTVHAAVQLFGEVYPFVDPARARSRRNEADQLLPALGDDEASARDTLDCAEAAATSSCDVAGARELAERVLARSPTNVKAWWLKIRSAKQQNEHIDDVILEALAATGDASFEQAAEQIRVKRGEHQPFANLPTATLTPGRLLLETLRHYVLTPQADGDAAIGHWLKAWRVAEAFAKNLESKKHREAFHVGVFSFALGQFDLSSCAELAAALLRDPPGSVFKAVAPLLDGDVRLGLGVEERVHQLASALVSTPGCVDTLPRFIEALVQFGLGDVAQRVVQRTAAALTRSVLRSCQNKLGFDLAAPPGAITDWADKALHPEICLYKLLESHLAPALLAQGTPSAHQSAALEDVPPVYDEDAARELDAEIEELGWLTKLYRIDSNKLKALSPERKEAFLFSIYTLDPEEPGSLNRARLIAEEFGVAKPKLGSLVPKSLAPKSAQEKNQQKRDRKQRKKGKRGK